jgi:hypothetical protein
MPAPVRVVHRIADLAGEVERLGHVERTLAEDLLLQRLALDVFHHDEEEVLLLLDREHRHDVGVAHRGQQARLLELLQEVHALLVGDLERDFLVHPGVVGEVHAAETAAAERRQDAVLADDLAAEEHLRASIACAHLAAA